jgi:hypothetical protein
MTLNLGGKANPGFSNLRIRSGSAFPRSSEYMEKQQLVANLVEGVTLCFLQISISTHVISSHTAQHESEDGMRK